MLRLLLFWGIFWWCGNVCSNVLTLTAAAAVVATTVTDLPNTFTFYNGIENSRVQTTTYLVSNVVKTLVTIEIANKGSKSADYYLIAIPKNIHDKLARLQVLDGNGKQELLVKPKIKVEFNAEDSKNFETSPNESVFYLVQLAKTLPADKGETTIKLELTLAFIHLMEPLPSTISKTGKQFMIFTTNRNLLSPYSTGKLTSKYIFSSDKFKSFPKPVASQEDKKLTYGPFTGIKPLEYVPFQFHFQFHLPVLTITEMVRDIEVSHWGNVRVEESFQMRHDGAKLTGAYEVGQYDRIINKDPSVVTQLRAILPRRAYGTYYVDRIGNISTSHFRNGPKESYLEIKPRYPLYGGWKTDFTIGYDVPSQDMITVDQSTHVHTLNLSFGIPFREPVTDLLMTKIALPEGAYDVEIDCPFEFDEEPRSKRYTYLDTMLFGGRPLITFHKRNVINLHNEYYQVRYKYDHFRVYYKLVLLIGGFFSFFIFVVVILRINPSLDSNTEKEARQKAIQAAQAAQVVSSSSSSEKNKNVNPPTDAPPTTSKQSNKTTTEHAPKKSKKGKKSQDKSQ